MAERASRVASVLVRRLRRRRARGAIALAGELTRLWLVAGLLLPVELRLRFLRPLSLPTLLIVLVTGGIVPLVWWWAIAVGGSGERGRHHRHPPGLPRSAATHAGPVTSFPRRGGRVHSNGIHTPMRWPPRGGHHPHEGHRR